jgi:hypothetical protein
LTQKVAAKDNIIMNSIFENEKLDVSQMQSLQKLRDKQLVSNNRGFH